MDARDTGGGIPVAALLVDPESMAVEWANDVALQWVGREAADVIGETIEEIVPMAQALGMYDDMRAVAETGEPRHATSFVMAAGGAQHYSGSIYMLPNGYLLVMAAFSGE